MVISGEHRATCLHIGSRTFMFPPSRWSYHVCDRFCPLAREVPWHNPRGEFSKIWRNDTTPGINRDGVCNATSGEIVVR